MAGGKGESGGQAYQPAPTPVNPVSEEQLAAEERKRQEENAQQLEADRKKRTSSLGVSGELGDEDEMNKVPSLLGGVATATQQ